MNFTDPTSVSTGADSDNIITTIKNPGMFMTESGGKSLDPAKAKTVAEVPPQLPKGMDAAALEAQAQ
jgi:hypothetical protein